MARKKRQYLQQEQTQEPVSAMLPSVWETAIYARLSVENSKKNDDGDSIEGQIEICRDYVAEHPYLHLADTYVDNGWTGTNTDRPEFQRLLSDIREEAEIMTELVNRLVSLARMDEDGTKLTKEPFSLSEVVLDTVSAFAQHINSQRKRLLTDVPDHISYHGNEAAMRQLISILLDNAVKYCDPEGMIRVSLRGGKHPTILVDNSYMAIGSVELDRLCERFYSGWCAAHHRSGRSA